MSNTEPENKIVSQDSASISQNNLSPSYFDGDLEDTGLLPGLACALTLDGERARAAGACPLLDTHTLSSTEVNKSRIQKYFIKKTSKKLFSRVMLGLLLPGRYYFLTLTSSPESPPLEKSWRNFRQWLHYQRPGITYAFVITGEGHGVIHIVLRLKPRHKNLEQKVIQEYWEKTHKAKQVRIERVGRARNLANYFADQRKLRKMGSEMSWQDLIVRWKYSPGWLPHGFISRFRKVWYQCVDAPDEIRDKAVRDLIRYHWDCDKKASRKKKVMKK